MVNRHGLRVGHPCHNSSCIRARQKTHINTHTHTHYDNLSTPVEATALYCDTTNIPNFQQTPKPGTVYSCAKSNLTGMRDRQPKVWSKFRPKTVSRSFDVVCLSFCCKIPHRHLKLVQDRFLPHPCQFISHCSSQHWTLHGRLLTVSDRRDKCACLVTGQHCNTSTCSLLPTQVLRLPSRTLHTQQLCASLHQSIGLT